MFKQNSMTGKKCFCSVGGCLLLILLPVICQAELQDPTKPDYPAPASVNRNNNDVNNNHDALVLSAIWITATEKWAIINGITVKEGQKLLNNLKIIKISRNAVWLKQNHSIRILHLLPTYYTTS